VKVEEGEDPEERRGRQGRSEGGDDVVDPIAIASRTTQVTIQPFSASWPSAEIQ
jgi:hypothetical protein